MIDIIRIQNKIKIKCIKYCQNKKVINYCHHKNISAL